MRYVVLQNTTGEKMYNMQTQNKNAPAFLKAARILRELSKTNYYSDSPETLLDNSKKAARVVGLMVKDNLVPKEIAKQPLLSSLSYDESIKELRSQRIEGNTLSSLSIAVELSHRAVLDKELKKPEGESIFHMKGIFSEVGEAIKSSAEKMERLSDEQSKRLPIYSHGLLGI